MRTQAMLALLILVAASGCHRRPTGPTTGDGIPISEIDNEMANNSVTSVDEPDAAAANK